MALQWKLVNAKILSLPAETLLKAFEEEVDRFRAYSLKTCTNLVDKMQKAFKIAEPDPVHLTSIKVFKDPFRLCDEWESFVKSAVKNVQRREAAVQQFGRNSVVGGLIGTIKTSPDPPKSSRHPRGAIRVRSSKAKKSVSFDFSSSSDKDDLGKYSVSSSDDDDPPPTKRQRESEREAHCRDDIINCVWW